MQRLRQRLGESMHFVFVHLGVAKAEHLRPNLKRLQRLFPQIPVTLIYSDLNFLSDYQDLPVLFHRYTESKDSTHILNNLSHNSNFRNNFWRYSIERLFALSEWHDINTEAKMLHLESDILIMPNFPIEKFESIETISWCSFSESHDVASIVYSPSHLETRWMTLELEKLLREDPTLTDMTGLRKLVLKFPNRSSYLNSKAAYEMFGGIFDAAPFGMWLCGRDPRNYKGITRRFMSLPESDIDPSSASFTFGRKSYLSVKLQGKNLTHLFNLHIHSKQKVIFGQNWRLVIALYVLTSRIKFPNTWFSPMCFLKLLINSFRRNGMQNFWIQIRALNPYK